MPAYDGYLLTGPTGSGGGPLLVGPGLGPLWVGGPPASGPPPVEPPEPADPLESRDLHVWRAIVEALEGTGAFASVGLGERPATHSDFGAGATPAAVLTPLSWGEADPWDDPVDVEVRVDGRFLLTIVHRDEDAARRFATLDRLHQVAANAIDGRHLGGLTIPGLTRLRSGSYEPAAHPEKHLVLQGEYAYLVPGNDRRDEGDDPLDPFDF